MTEASPTTDPAADALALGLQILGLPVNAADIVHQSGRQKLDATDLIRFALQPSRSKSWLVRSNIGRLATTPLPALARRRDGSWLVVGRVSDREILVQDPRKPLPSVMPLAEFGAEWDGYLLLMTRRASLTRPVSALRHRLVPRRHPQVPRTAHRGVRRLVFVQLFTLLTPLFFQVIIDKVFVQRGHVHARGAGDRSW